MYDIKDGDLICFAGTTWLSRLIRWYTNGLYSHTAFAMTINGRVFLLESMDGGIRLFPLDGILEASRRDGCRAYWHKLKPEYEMSREAIIKAAMELWEGVHQKRYVLSTIVCKWFGLLWRFLRGNDAIAKESYLCTEFVVAAMNKAEIKTPMRPVEATPQGVSELTCFEDGIELCLY